MTRVRLSQSPWVRTLQDRRGNVAILFALGMPLVVGGAALGVEAGVWYFDQQKLQQAVDAAAYAAGIEQRAGSSTDVTTTAANTALNNNGFDAAVDTLTLHTPPTSGAHQTTNAVEVSVTHPETRYFSQLFNTTPVVVRARTVASYTSSSTACVLALDPSAAQSVYFSGNSTITMNGCNVMTNSLSNASIYSQGSTVVTVPCLMTAGGVSLNSPVTETSCAAPMTQLSVAADPYRNVPEPTIPVACANPNASPLLPGRYCGGLTLNGNKTLSPGTYIVDGGTLKTNGNANISGTGVTIFLANDATISINANSTLDLSPTTTGSLSGILLFGSRSNSTANLVTINGNNSSVMTGAIYFPKQTVSYIGNFQGANGCTQIVARIIQWSGNSTLGVNCSAYGMSAVQVGGVVRLVE